METHFLNQPVYTSDVILPECKPPCRGFSIDVYICVFLYALLTGIKTYVQNQANTEIEMWRQLLDLLVYVARPLKKKKKKEEN